MDEIPLHFAKCFTILHRLLIFPAIYDIIFLNNLSDVERQHFGCVDLQSNLRYIQAQGTQENVFEITNRNRWRPK